MAHYWHLMLTSSSTILSKNLGSIEAKIEPNLSNLINDFVTLVAILRSLTFLIGLEETFKIKTPKNKRQKNK
ncbi:hypothetical protein MTR_2g105890 [Medicago truncatula]|uniref:Uncharacterized protein n=1 Tax=Medicago truncatula TaxID=3880 RepID=A0A072VE09_MEDTR|nr:hypothetical protein MTR_2g105890 [Medicago truncatula]